MLLLQGQYLENGATKRKNKSTFFSRTFKVEESKVPLFFSFVRHKTSYSHFIILTIGKISRNVEKPCFCIFQCHFSPKILFQCIDVLIFVSIH